VLLLKDEVVASPSCRKPGGCVVVVIGRLAASELLLELLRFQLIYVQILKICCGFFIVFLFNLAVLSADYNLFVGF
jgi:hypothetical protein